MCYPVSCDTCGKTTWAGCGEHIDAALAAILRLRVRQIALDRLAVEILEEMARGVSGELFP